MHERHQNKQQYFSEQAQTTSKHVIPYLQEVMEINANTRVLEVGCGEGGNLVPFAEMGCQCRGVDINAVKIKLGNANFSKSHPEADIELYYENIYETDPAKLGRYDLVILRDVIEHLPDQSGFLSLIKQFLTPNGKVFFGFPPWYMPFGGHQQVLENKLLSKLPYFHILPTFLYKGILKMGGESKPKIDAMIEIKDTGITIERFNEIVRQNDFQIDKGTYWFINPNYETKFGLTPRNKIPILGDIPFIRNFVTTCYYCVISEKKS